VLLVLDNVEHLLEAAPQVGEFLGTAPGLKVLATSRVPLRLRAEREYPVPPLSLPRRKPPPTADQLSQYEAVRLFIQRAQAVKPDFAVDNENAPAIAEICHRLDGLPLAIELAAARVRMLPPRALLARLGQRLPFLTGGARDAPERQRTLRATIAWSHDILQADEQVLFQRLAIFSGGATFEAAEAVINSEGNLDVFGGLERLVEQSLVRSLEGLDGDLRFVMLETIREFGLEQLKTTGAADAIWRRYAEHFLTLVEQAESGLSGPEQAVWLDRIEEEHDNLRAVLGWALEHHDEVGLRLSAGLGQFWSIRGYVTEGRAWLERAALQAASAPLAVQAPVLLAVGQLAVLQDDHERAGEAFEVARVAYSELGDERGLARALTGLGDEGTARGDHTTARVLIEEALARYQAIRDRQGEARCLRRLAYLAAAGSEPEQANEHFHAAARIAREIGDLGQLATAQTGLAWLAFLRGDVEHGARFTEEALSAYHRLKDKAGISDALTNLGIAAIVYGDPSEGVTRLEEALVTHQEQGSKVGAAVSFVWLGEAARYQGDLDRAAAHFNDALRLSREIGDPIGVASSLNGLARLAAVQGDDQGAVAFVGEALQTIRSIGEHATIAESLEALAVVLARCEYQAAAARLLGAAEGLREVAGVILPPPDRPAYNALLASLAADLSEVAFHAAKEAGKTLAPEEAVSEALERVDDLAAGVKE
jgi:predicted ATPase